MSKIEEALKKARESRISSEVGHHAGNPLTSRRHQSNVRELIPLADNGTTVNRESSSKEIALMKQGDLFSNEQLAEMRIVHSDMHDVKIANSYRDMRTKLIQRSSGRNFITMLTSCVQGDECSNAVLNLSSAFSFDESKTSLLIDCNINSPRIDKRLGLNDGMGLTDYLENEHIDVELILHSSGIKRLKVIPAGTARESTVEYFTSLRMRQLMANLLNRYNDRFIFMDTAPVTESADTRILVELCDFVILVVPYGRCTKNKIRDAASAIGKDKLLGVVFSDMPQIPKFRFPNLNKLFGV